MTVATPGGGEVAVYDEDLASVGLEDVGVGDVVIPRLQIQHKEGTFLDNLSKATFASLKVVLLGLVKQRIMWDDEVNEGDRPKCKSPDFEHGFPNVNYDGKTPPGKQFDWKVSNFNPEDYPAENGLNGLVTLPCTNCIFKEWDKGDWKQPPCSEQHTYPLLYSPDEGASWQPALLTVQRTGIKPSRQYISSFAQAKTPMFTVFTEIGLTQQKRGSVDYSVPWFKRHEATDRNAWPEFASQYRAIREFIRQPPRRLDEEETVSTDSNVNTAPAPAAGPTPPATPPAPPAAPAAPPAAPAAPAQPTAPAAEAPTPAPVAAAADGDDDLPF
jgi:hypothetical protein